MKENTGVGAFGETKKTARKGCEPPCKVCKEHSSACHATCERYKAWLEDCKARGDEIRQAKADTAIYQQYARKKRKHEREF